jgi:signal transduction histidine kinase
LVEDDHDLRDALTDALVSAGHRVSPVSDGDAALRAMRATVPDVVVLDLMMPTMDGWQFRVEQRRDPKLARVPVVAMSASASSTAAAVDADLYLRKPVDARTLTRAIDDVLEARARRDAPARHAEAERIAALGTLAAGVAHEVNNPLTYVLLHLTHATRLLGNIRGPENRPVVEKLETLLRGATEGADRIRTLTGGIRAFSQLEELPRAPIDVHRVLGAALELVRADVRQRARLLELDGPLPIVMANEGRLAQVFLNLLTNALQAMGEGDASSHTLRIATSTDPRGWAIVEIGDDGDGVPEHLAARIFEPFFSTRPVGQGAGLGLSISQGIVASLGGELVLRREAKGSTFVVALPPANTARTGS